MIVIAKNAEEKLYQELQKCRTEAPSQRCFTIDFSKLNVPRQKLFEVFLKILQDVPNSYMAQVYICEDCDVFVLMSGFMQRQFEEFLDKIAGDLEVDNIKDLGNVYEVGVHWTHLKAMCVQKIDAAQRARDQINEVQRKEEAEQIAFDTLSKLNTDLISSIAQRRTNRPDSVVLIVDDDQLSRTLAGNVLRESYPCTFAQDGQEALERFVETAPDVVFLDIGMPDISGHEVLETLFQIDPDAYVIMFSGRKDEANMMRALETGAQGFLGKPFTREKLFQHVEKSPFIQEKNMGGHVNESATI